MTLGQTLRYLREERGLSRRELWERTERQVSEREIAYLESDSKDPRRETLAVLSAELGLAVLEAAFPVLAGRLDDPAERPTARYRARARWLRLTRASDVGPSAA
jgi:transcriptional regulator with XRE-family HTH domain